VRSLRSLCLTGAPQASPPYGPGYRRNFPKLSSKIAEIQHKGTLDLYSAFKSRSQDKTSELVLGGGHVPVPVTETWPTSQVLHGSGDVLANLEAGVKEQVTSTAAGVMAQVKGAAEATIKEVKGTAQAKMEEVQGKAEGFAQ
jgi:hypothetical protein